MRTVFWEKVGLETLYENELRGTDGCKISIVDQDGQERTVLAKKETENGQDITTTIDSELQEMLYRQFENDKSCSVAMNPFTGEILALVSTPSYDSNDFVLGMSQSVWDSLNEDEDQPMYNRFRQTCAWFFL